MIASSKEKDFQAKQEADTSGGDGKFSKAPSTSSSRQWSAFRNPRIVRVSRTFGGKDRHSKVCTIRGLRDRRIRLSVPTAIQLYDLQDRLGLSQPSKVIDWLIDNTKDDIDKLPPLPIPQGFGHQFHQPFMGSHHESNPSLPPFFDANAMFMKDGGLHSLGIKINSDLEVHHEDQNIMARPKYWEVEASMRARNKEVDTTAITEKGKWIGTNEGNDQDGVSNYSGQVLSAQKFFPMGSSHASSLLGLPPSNPIPMPFNSYCHWDPSNLSLSQFGSHGLQPQSQTETALSSSSSNAVSLALPSSSLALSSGSQLFFCPPPATLPSLFPYSPTYITTGPVENDSRPEINHFQLLGSSSQHPPVLHHHQNPSRTMSSTMKPFSLSVNPAGPPGLLYSLSSNESHPDGKDNAES